MPQVLTLFSAGTLHLCKEYGYINSKRKWTVREIIEKIVTLRSKNLFYSRFQLIYILLFEELPSLGFSKAHSTFL